MTPILILAAGLSNRDLSTDHLLTKHDGVPLLVRTVRIAAATGHQVFVAIPGPSHARYRTLKDEPAACIDVPEAREGISGMLYGALKRLPSCDALMIMLADQPYVTTKDLNKVYETRNENRNALIWRAVCGGGDFSHPLLISHQILDAIKSDQNKSGAKQILSGHSSDTIPVPLGEQYATSNLDSLIEWKNWEFDR